MYLNEGVIGIGNYGIKPTTDIISGFILNDETRLQPIKLQTESLFVGLKESRRRKCYYLFYLFL